MIFLRHHRYYSWVIGFFMLLSTSFAQQRTPSAYISHYKGIAQQLMQESGVPASVILAVAMHESANGNSRIAKHLNNHFGIKGKNNSRVIRSAYKGYASISASFTDFIDLLKRKKSTASLFENNDPTAYKQWVKAIQRSGYSTSKSWSSRVLATIERYNLDQYDYIHQEASVVAESADLLQQANAVAQHVSQETFDLSETHTVRQGDTLSAIAQQYNIEIDTLVEKNKLLTTELSIGQRLFL